MSENDTKDRLYVNAVNEAPGGPVMISRFTGDAHKREGLGEYLLRLEQRIDILEKMLDE